MREIGYRAYIKDIKKVVDIHDISFLQENIGFTDPKNTRYSYRNFDEIELMQFTGLTDKNGKPIYDGDILQLCNATYPCEIYWSGISWAIKRNGKRVEYSHGSSLVINCEKMQVIGNIYDNPELLGGAE